MSNDNDQPEHTAKKSTFKIVAIAVSAVLVTAALMAATGSFAGIIAYGQNTDSNMTTFEEEASATETTTSGNATSNNTGSQTNETTTTASAVADSTCAPVMTATETASIESAITSGQESTDELDFGPFDGNGNETTSATNASSSDGATNTTTTAGATTSLNESQVATLDALIENACDAIRDGQSVTALGFLSSAQDILDNIETESGTETAAQTDDIEDEDEPNDVDAADDAEDEIEENDS